MNEATAETLSELAIRQHEAEMNVQEKEEALANAKLEFRNISENLIPELMDMVGLAEVTTLNGLHVVVETNIVAGITKANMPKAYAWIRENGHSKMIKNKFTVIPGNDVQGETLAQALIGMEGLDIKRVPSIHAGTLKKFVRLELEAGRNIPMELLGVFRKRVAKVGEK